MPLRPLAFSLRCSFFVISCLCLADNLPAQNGVLTLQIGPPSVPPQTLVNHADSWLVRKGTNAPQASWKTAPDPSLDATWWTASGGFGYADNSPELQLCQTILSDMLGNYSTFYMRKSITIASTVDPNLHLLLKMDWDDGFIAWLDGVYLVSSNSPSAPSEPAFNGTAGNLHESSNGDPSTRQPAVTYDLGAVGSRLSVGTHVLAILGLNQSLGGSSDFIQIADLQLSANSPSSANAGPFVALVQSNSVSLSGSNTIAGSARVTVNADDATFSAGQGIWSKTVALAPGLNKLFIAAHDGSGAILGSTNYILVSETNATSVGGTLTGSNYWNRSMGIIHVTSTVIVPPTATLWIDSGMVLMMSSGANILATNTTLAATGTVDRPTCFFPLGASTNWGEVAVSGTNGFLALDYLEMIGGHVEIFDGAVGRLRDSFFHDYEVSSPPIIHTLGQPHPVTLDLQRCHISHYYEILSQVATNHIQDCLCEYLGYSGDGIDFDQGLPGSYIRRCTVRRGLQFNTDAIDIGELNGDPALGSRGILIDSCILHDFVDKGVSMGVAVQVTVTNTLIYNVDTGIAVKDNSIAGIYNNTIAEANYGYRGYNKANPAAPDGGGFITNSFNNILWHFTNETYSLLNGSTMTAIDTDFYATNYPGPGNISSDPLFLNAPVHDYRVASNSPTLGAGLGGANLGITFPVGGIPAAPLNCAALITISNQIRIVWMDDSDNETGFLIFRSPGGLLGSAAANVTNFVDSTAVPGQKYYYWVVAANIPGQGDSPASNLASPAIQTTLMMVSPARAGNAFTFHFTAFAGYTYSVQYRDAFDPAHPWQTLINVPPQPSTADYAVTNSPATGQARFYRLVSPAQ